MSRYDQIGICNMALAQIMAQPIESLDEDTVEAREASRFYPQCLDTLLEAHSWGFATRHATLAPIVNPRSGTWRAAFAMPIDVARPLRVSPAAALVNVRSAIGLYGDDLPSVPYSIEDNVLFAAVDDAVFTYVTKDVTAAALPSKFVDALVLDLASWIAMPIKRDRQLKGDLLQLAEVARQRAIANDENRQPPQESWVDTVQLARDGGSWGGWSGDHARIGWCA